MSAGSASNRVKLVGLFLAATLIAGSLAVALPLNSPENNSSEPKLRMYSNASGTTELPKKNGVYVVRTSEIVYLQLTGLSDNNIMSSGTTQNGELEVLIHYSHEGSNYDILFKQVAVQNGNSEIFPWTVGDFSADRIFNPNDPRDEAILCDTTGVVMYGKVSSTGFRDLLTASTTAPDFIGYCGPENSQNVASSGSTNTGSHTSGYSNSGSTTGSGESHDGDGKVYCYDERINGNLKITDEHTYVKFESCDINGNVKIENSHIGFIGSSNNGNIKSDDSKLVIKGGEVRGNVKVESGYLHVEGAEIYGNVHVEDTSLYLGGNTIIHGNLKCEGLIEYSIYDTVVKGKVKGCELNGSSSGSGSINSSSNNNDDDDDNGDCKCKGLTSLTVKYTGSLSPVTIQVKQKGQISHQFNGVQTGGQITVTPLPNETKLAGDTIFRIFDANGNFVKEIKIHTSCSQPIEVGMVFGDLTITALNKILVGNNCPPPPPPQTGTIIIKKITNGGDDTFGFTISGPTPSTQSITTTNGFGTTGPITVTPGTYSVTETTIPPSWSLVSSTCPQSFSVQASQTVVCIFTNKKELPPPEKGTIKIIKDTIPDDPQDFGFTTTGGLTPPTFSLDDDSDGTLSNTQIYSNVALGSYTVTENLVAGFTLIGIVCIDPDNGTTTSLSQRKANIDLDAGETVVCIFENQKEVPPPPQKGTIKIIKETIPDDPQDFGFTTTGGLTPPTFSLDDDTDPTLSNTQIYTNVAPGAYTVTESSVASFTLISIICVDPDGQTTTNLVTRTANIDLDAGEVVICIFKNEKQVQPPPPELIKLTVVKKLKQQDGTLTVLQGAQVIVTDKTTGQQVASGTTGADGSFMTNLPKGTYIVKVIPSQGPNGCQFVPVIDTAEIILSSPKIVQFINTLVCPQPTVAKIIVVKFLDQGMIGVKDPADVPLPGVKINLLDILGNLKASGITDANGVVIFDVIAASNTQFQITEPSQILSGNCKIVGTKPILPLTITVSGGQTKTVEILNELECPKAKLTVIKFEDLDGDGIRDTTPTLEPLFEGFVIQVFDEFGKLVAQGTTNKISPLVFELVPSKYIVKEVFPTPPFDCSFIQTFPGSATGFQHVVVLQEPGDEIKFGNKLKCLPPTQPPATVQVFKIRDTNENNHIDCKPLVTPPSSVFCETLPEAQAIPPTIIEPGLQSWTIQVFDSSGNLVASKVTDLTGHVSFSLVPGTYTFKEVNGPLPTTCPPDPQTQKPRIPVQWKQIFPTPNPDHTINVVAGDHRILLFGNKLECEVLAKIKVEKLVNGLPGDGLIAQHPVTIQVFDQTGTKLIASAQTQIEQNNRAFATFFLRAGTYVIREALPSTVPDNCIAGHWELINVEPQPQPFNAAPGEVIITLSPGEEKLDEIKFNNKLVCPNVGKLNVTKFNDKDGDGIRDMVPFVEPGVAGFLIKVYHPNDLTTPIAKALTDSNGVAMFILEPLPLGQQYVIREDLFGPIPPDCASGKWVQTFPGAASNFEHKVTIPDRNPSGPPNIVSKEFGNQLSCFVPPAKLVVHKFHDDNQDGFENNSESGLPGFKIKVLNSQGTPALDASGLPLEGITDSSGTVMFTLQPGQYIVYEFFRVVQPGECDGGKWIQTSPGPASAQPDPKVASMAPNPIVFTILPGETKHIKFGNFLGPCFNDP